MRSRDSQFSQFATRKSKLLLRKLVVLNLFKKIGMGLSGEGEKTYFSKHLEKPGSGVEQPSRTLLFVIFTVTSSNTI